MAGGLSEENKYEIPVQGSLGLLALGYRGLIAWRNVRDAGIQEGQSPSNSEGEN